MKLSEYLKELVGKEITPQHIATISQEIDGIKGRALEKIQGELKSTKALLNETKENLSKYTEAEGDKALKDAFIKAGGKEERFESFKKTAGKVEDVKAFDFKANFKEFPSLTEGKVPAYNGQDISSIKTGDGTGVPSADEELDVV